MGLMIKAKIRRISQTSLGVTLPTWIIKLYEIKDGDVFIIKITQEGFNFVRDK